MDPLVVAAFAIVVILEILIPIAIGLWLIRQYGLDWKVFGLGALFFVVVQIIHTPLVLMIQGPVYLSLQGAYPNGTLAIGLFALVLGLLAGLFEEVGRYLVFRHLFPGRRIGLFGENGLLFGAGWGGIESILVALLVISSMVSYILLSTDAGILNLTPGSPEALQVQALLALTPLDILPGLAERIMTITLHIAWTIMVLTAVVSSRPAYLALAIFMHTLVDFAAVYLGMVSGVIAAEVAIFAFAVAGVVYLRWQWPRLPHQTLPQE
jgi:uncharacterized membrane protein YhfC